VVLEKLKDFTPGKTFEQNINVNNVNINTDSVKFFQVVHNLISNAIKFTGEGGVITISLNEEEGHYLFSVADNGIGIPAELQPYIFDKRSVAGRTGLQGERSNGIGLSIIKRLVQLLQGEIWFESEEHKGSTFYVRLPKE
jgi:two-component system sensor histidine kinase VicK